jgi:hypothetical protein
MRILLSMAGIVAWIGYSLSRYRAFGVPLDTVAMVGSLAVAPWMAWDGWRQGYGWHHFLAALAGLLLFVLLLVLRLKRYIVYRREPFAFPQGVRQLAAEEKVKTRVAGNLEVEGQRRHFVDIPGSFHTTELSDHIVMARLSSRRSLGLLKSEAAERGWWYAFISPRKVRSIEWTRVFHGFGRRRAIKVEYTREDGKDSTLFLGFDGPEDFALVARELCSRSGLGRSASVGPKPVGTGSRPR